MTKSSVESAREAQISLETDGHAWWTQGEVDRFSSICLGVAHAELRSYPDLARGRALLGLMRERDDALECLELAYAGHLARGAPHQALVDSHIALVCCLIDSGAMDGVTTWLKRVAAISATPFDEGDANSLWLACGAIAAAVFDNREMSTVANAIEWLHGQLRPMRARLTADERLIAAQVLVSVHLNQREFEKFDLIANVVGAPAVMQTAAPLMQARWLYTLGWTHYQIGSGDRAQAEWQRALEIADTFALEQMKLQVSLALLRLLIDRGRLDQAQQVEATIRPQWGAGREMQLISLKQLSARLLLMRGHSAQALATLREALALADQIQLSRPDRGSCLTDLCQVLVANDQTPAAIEMLDRLASEHSGRDGEVYRALLELLRTCHRHDVDESERRRWLASGLHRARHVRYTMFFRLLPQLAARCCALALLWDIEVAFVLDVIRSRNLPAPPDAGPRWPWVVYLSLLGDFDLKLRDQQGAHKRSRKVPRKPLELLCALACRPNMSWSVAAAADALWPEAEGDLAHKSLEMAVKRLRELLADDVQDLVRVSDGQLSLNPSRVSSDFNERRTLIRQLEDLAMANGSVSQSVALVRRITEMSIGALLPGMSASPWLQAERDRDAQDQRRVGRLIDAISQQPGTGPVDRALLDAARRDLSTTR
jgi:tetratricopeptide (TPR) repeat protein